MDLIEQKTYVSTNLHYVPQEELELFKFNFACVMTRNTVNMEKMVEDLTLEEVVSIVKGFNVRTEGNLRRNIYNHYQAYLFMIEHIEQKGKLNEDFLKDLHEILMKGIMPGGLYRNVDIRIIGSNYIPPSHIKVYDRMKKYFYELENFHGSDLDYIVFAHLQLSKIHPFLDGNGRLARLILNFCLLEKGYLPVIISIKDRKRYFNALEEFKVNKNIHSFDAFLKELLNKEYHRMISLINKHKKDAN